MLLKRTHFLENRGTAFARCDHLSHAITSDRIAPHCIDDAWRAAPDGQRIFNRYVWPGTTVSPATISALLINTSRVTSKISAAVMVRVSMAGMD